MPIDPWLWNTSPVPLARPAIEIRVYRDSNGQSDDGESDGFHPSAYFPSDFFPGNTSNDDGPELLDNVECLALEQQMGIDPGRAILRYRFTGLDSSAPQSVEEALSNSSTGGKIIEVGDHLIITATQPGGTEEVILEGEPILFGMELGPASEQVPITLIGGAKQAWDNPVDGLYLRDSSDIMTGEDLDTDIPAQFNPKGKPNATPSGAEVEPIQPATKDYRFPTFMDPNIKDNPDNKRRTWTLAMAARYLIYRYLDKNPDTTLTLPTGDVLDDLLVSLEPIGADFDPTNPLTYTIKDINAPDRPLTGRDWPGLLNDMIRDKGFGMTWAPGVDNSGDATTTLKLFLLQKGPLKDVYLQARGSNLDPEKTNIGYARIQRDLNQVVNQWEVKGALKRYEASIILLAGFPMVPADSATVESIAAFDSSSPTWADNSDKYRLFIFDEAGEGHYPNGQNQSDSTPGNLDDIFGMPANNGTPMYTKRRRKPVGDCLSSDDQGDPYRYTLAISTDYAGPTLKPWDRSGHWQTISGGYSLLEDRLGIRITATNPNNWKIGKSDDANAPFPSGIVNVVECLSQQNAEFPFFFLRLTCSFDGDNCVSGLAEKTSGSVIRNTIARQIDARDRFKLWTVCESSEHNDGSPDQKVRDDSDAAKAEAIAARVASEAGILDGEIVIPRFTRYYQIGDRIRQINGRDLGFRTDSGDSSNGNAPIYPVVVGVRHELAGGQKTILSMSDQDGHRHKIEGKTKRH